jgi:hypothetical protein
MSHKGQIQKFTVAIFADVGDEPDEVYRHLEWLTKEVSPSFPVIVRSKGVKLSESLVSGINGTKRFASIPAFTDNPSGSDGGMTKRQCTSEFKVAVVEREIKRQILKLKPKQRWPKDVVVHQYFGLSFDEGRRVSRVRARMSEWHSVPHFPLYDLQMTRKDCERWLEKYMLPHKVPRSACVFCPYKSNEEWRRLRDNDPEGWKKAVAVDRSIRDKDSVCCRGLKSKLYLHRSCVPLDQADIEEPQTPYDQYKFSFVNDCEGMCGL